jgi:hypothetical protein
MRIILLAFGLITAIYLIAKGIDMYLFFCFTRHASGRGRWKR